MKSLIGSRQLARVAVTLLACAVLLPGFQTKPGQTKPTGSANNPQAGAPGDQAPEQTASVEGTVLDAKLGKPVKDVTLLLAQSNGATAPSSAKTDETGHFLFGKLAAGTYLLIADHPRYARQTYGSRNGLLGGAPLTLTLGQGIKDLTFKIQPNAVASGKVLDEDGEPMPGVLVAAAKGMYVKGKRQFLPLGTGITNDLGEYRIANLAAGRYLVSATKMSLNAAATPKPAGDEPEKVYITTYYPNATEATGAAPVDVTAGGDVGGMDIRMAKAKSVRIKGRVLGAPGDQAVTVRLIAKDAGVLSMITGRSATVKKADGTFEIVGVTPGTYTLRAGDQSGMKAMGAGIQVQVADQPMESVVMEIAPAGELTGILTVSKNDKLPVKGARVMLESIEGLVMLPPNATVGEDGTFTLKDLPPDKYLVRVMNGPPNSFLESVKFGAQEMGDRGLDLGGAAPGKLEVKLNPGGAQVDGVIRGQDDSPISGVTVALIPDSGRYLLYQSTFTDQNGGFSFKGVTPGEYKVLAWEDVEPNAFQDPEFVKPFMGKAESVSLKENDHRGVGMKAIPREQR
jgi:protocatechuate 3,4-dioxygenase beta subunit